MNIVLFKDILIQSLFDLTIGHLIVGATLHVISSHGK